MSWYSKTLLLLVWKLNDAYKLVSDIYEYMEEN